MPCFSHFQVRPHHRSRALITWGRSPPSPSTKPGAPWLVGDPPSPCRRCPGWTPRNWRAPGCASPRIRPPLWRGTLPCCAQFATRVRRPGDPIGQTGRVLLIDAANVVGSRPTGWWRDRAGAARTFVGQVRAAVTSGRIAQPVIVVLEGKARQGMQPGLADGVTVQHAVGSGDDMLVDIAGRASDQKVTLVTADRELRRRAEALGADVVGPNWLYERLDIVNATRPRLRYSDRSHLPRLRPPRMRRGSRPQARRNQDRCRPTA